MDRGRKDKMSDTKSPVKIENKLEDLSRSIHFFD